MKQLPKLTLVAKDEVVSGSKTAGPTFELVSLEDLAPAERNRVQHIVHQLLPKAAILAVAKTNRAWDLRPVVTRPGESSPSVIRFAGPDIQASSHINARLRETFERLKGLENLSSMLLSWGAFEQDLWFRRPLVELTLAHVLSGTHALTEEQTFAVAFSLVEEVFRWHERGLVHAHITSANIVVNATGKVGLLDAGIGLATVQTSRGRTEYNLQSFAPELLGGQTVVYSSDIYGIGLVIRRLFLTLSKHYQFEKNREEHEAFIRPFIDLSTAMLDQDPRRRPGLPQVRHFIADAYERRRNGKNEASRTRQPTTQRVDRAVPVGHPIADQPSIADETPQVERVVEKVYEQPREPQNLQSAAAATQQTVPPYAAPQFVAPMMQQPAYVPGATYPGAAPAGFTGGPHVHTAIYQVMSGQAVPPGMGYVPPPGYIGPMPGPFVQQPYMVPPGLQYTAAPSPSSLPNIESSMSGMSNSGLPKSDAPRDRGLWPMVLIFGCILVGYYYHRTYGLEALPGVGRFFGAVSTPGNYTNEQLREDWESRLPSRMARVAQAAISRESANEYAESLIIRSAMKGEVVGNGVNVGLLRIAFDSTWEPELTTEDRRAALALGLGGLLKDNIPQDLPSLDRLHPGVLLALTANVSGRGVGKNFFASIPAATLTKLPPPWGQAFQELVNRHANLSCSDEAVQRLARLGTSGGVEIIDDLTAFLKEDSAGRLRVLAVLFSQDNRLAQSLLDVLLNHPNLSLEIDMIKWGKDWDLLKWPELEASDKLFVLSGMPPAQKVADENIGKMFSHPAAAMRGYAIGKAADRIKMKHPAAYEVFRQLQSEPALLGPKQTLELAQLLEDPSKTKSKTIESWMSSNPPQQILVPLLLATAEATEGTELDTRIAVHLKEKGWKPDLAMLRKLSGHPDKYTRLFAYTEIFSIEDRETVAALLRSAQAKEKDPQLRTQLEQMMLESAP